MIHIAVTLRLTTVLLWSVLILGILAVRRRLPEGHNR
jgi:hypothetical protein